MQQRQPSPVKAPSRPIPSYQSFSPDMLGRPASRPQGFWGLWLRLTSPTRTAGLITPQERERLRRARLLSALQLAAIVLIAILIPRGFFPVLDPGTVLGLIGFALIVLVSIFLNRARHVTAGSFVYVIGLAVVIAGSQLFTPSGSITFADLAGYDVLVIPVLITGILLPRQASIYMWLSVVAFIIVDLSLATHGASLDAYLPQDLPRFVNIYPVAIYPIVLSAVVAVISWLAAGSVEQAMHEADRTTDLEEAYALLANQNNALEDAIGIIQQVHSRIANGDLTARAPTAQGNLLLPLAISLNLMLERLMRTSNAQSNLESVAYQISMLSRYVAELGRGHLMVSIPQQQMGQLLPIATNIEQLRLGMLQVMRTSYTMVEAMTAEMQRVGTQVNATLNDSAQINQETLFQFAQSIEKLQQLSAAHQQYIRQYTE